MQYFINGIFFQDMRHLAIYFYSEAEGGVRPIIQEALTRFMYFGTIFPNPDNETDVIGVMTDVVGTSNLFEVEIIPEKSVRYIKEYHHRHDFINYDFKYENGIYVGEYSGEAVGRGNARCILTPIPDELLLPPPA